MFTSSSSIDNDPVRSILFACTIEFVKSRGFPIMKMTEDARNFFGEFLQYVERDRPLQVNEIIEAELNCENTHLFKCYLEENDVEYLHGIMNHRNLIFDSHEN